MTLPAVEFIRRFLTHILPRAMQYIRHFGFLAPRGRTERLNRIRRTLGVSDEAKQTDASTDEADEVRDEFGGDTDAEEERDSKACPACGEGRMVRKFQMPRPTVMEILTMRFPGQPRQRLLELDFT